MVAGKSITSQNSHPVRGHHTQSPKRVEAEPGQERFQRLLW